MKSSSSSATPPDQRPDLEMSAAAADDEPGQDNEKHSCGGDRPPVIFAPPWIGPPAVVAAGSVTSILEVWVYHFACRASYRKASVLSLCQVPGV